MSNWYLSHLHVGHLGDGLNYNVYVDKDSFNGVVYKSREVYADGGYRDSIICKSILSLISKHACPVPWHKLDIKYKEDQISLIKSKGIKLKYDWNPSNS